MKPLTEGETYQFRVRGENAAGLGEPSKPTDKVKVEHQPQKPEYVSLYPPRYLDTVTVDMKNLYDSVVTAGLTRQTYLPRSPYEPARN